MVNSYADHSNFINWFNFQFLIFNSQFLIFNSIFQFSFIKNWTKQFKQYQLKIEKLKLKTKLKIEIWQFSVQF